MPSSTSGASQKEAPLSIFHTPKLVTMKASVYVRIRKDKPTKDGLAAVYLQIRIEGQSDQIPLEISWPIENFENRQGIFLPRFKDDTTASDNNLYAQKELSKANVIFVRYRLSDQPLTVERFHREFQQFGLREDFISWSDQDNEQRYATGKIKTQTYKNIKSQLKKLEKWKSPIFFGELRKETLETIESWLRHRESMDHNSVWAIMKTIKSQAKRAVDDNIFFDFESVKRYQLPATKRRLVYLTPAELKKLWEYMITPNIAENTLKVLRCFLFSTLTGLRFSDLERVGWKHLHEDELTFEPFKTRGLNKVVSIPMPEDAWSLIENDRGNFFSTPTNQESNRTMKDVAVACGIRKNLTMHVARHTFATQFLRNGGQVHILQSLLGHSKITTTMIYVHVDTEMKRKGMELMKAPISGFSAALSGGKSGSTDPRAA